MRYQNHIFVCTNQKAEGKTCCGEARGMELVEKFRDAIKEAGLVGKVRAQRAGCLDACKHGPAVVVYPEGTYYGQVGPEDVKRIIEEHVIGGKELADKVISFKED
ncbi:MAG: (2Fe-2S) ferredoxin domain-containing protein [Bacteroidetes bacterium]|jgi:(2Fe-2S) ferredoxin|nr:(2Fe-2S) ferredoxin domain-containing protein [Bacteroidota bacterium]